ncbi:alpha/beta fold hydrolase [Kitasatospora sp. NPDC096147]|uniref:alpha/beta fold hydrolase n=1 Tax=Kitasatospora sp. NPDC096147 TaxID=3364093 RepID=UPI003806A63F
MTNATEQSYAATIRTFESEDGPLAYRDAGSGRPVVLLHGGFMDFTMWDAQVEALSASHRVIAPDARGHGASANASRPFRQCDDLAALLRHLDLGPAVLVGLSMGATIAVETVLEHPELVAGILISGGGTHEPTVTDEWNDRGHVVHNTALMSGDIEGWLDSLALWIAGPHREVADLDPELVRRRRDMALRTIMKHTPDEPNHHLQVPGTLARAAEVTVPVLAAGGALDSPALLSLATPFAQGAPNGRVADIPGTAHIPAMERPELYTAVVEGFLAEVYGA